MRRNIATMIMVIAAWFGASIPALAQNAPVYKNASGQPQSALGIVGVGADGSLIYYQPPYTASTTNRSITIATGGTAQQVMAANASRRSFYAFNPNASGTCWASFTTTTPTENGLGAFPMAPGGGFGMEASATTNALYVNCPTTGQFITAWESQ